MDIQAIIKKYDITLYGEDKLRVEHVKLLRKDGAETIVREKKSEIINYLKNKKSEETRAIEERLEKIKGIDGLEEIKEAIQKQVEWRENFNRLWERGDGYCSLGKKPEDNIAELKEKYPRAAAYLVAEHESLKSNAELAAIGKKALESIINGEDYVEVMGKMKDAQKAFVDRHFWD